MDYKPNLILDLDETLVKTFMYSLNEYIPFQEDNNDELLLLSYIIDNTKTIVYKRPFLFDFLLEMKQYFNISLYSLGQRNYVNTVVKKINQIIGYDVFKNIYSNDPNRMKYHKNLKLLNIDTFYDNCMIIDDRIDVWTYDSEKVYVINNYENPSINDIELLKLIIKIKKYMETHEIINCNELLLSLFNKDNNYFNLHII